MDTTGVGRTDIGRKRSHNEDNLLVDNDLWIYAVADGVGGLAKGEVAAQLALDTVHAYMKAHEDILRDARMGKAPPFELRAAANAAVMMASRAVFDAAHAQEEIGSMGATLTLLICAGPKAVIAHVGDSRIYVRRMGALHQLSTDHTMVAELVSAGVLSDAEAQGHPYANVLTRSIGSKATVKVDTMIIDVEPGDMFLLCSDGLHNYVPDPAWLNGRLSGGEPPDDIVDQLIEFANESGGKDNITALLVTVAKPPRRRYKSVARMRLDALRSGELFGDLSFRHLALLLGACRQEHLEPGDVLIRAGEPNDELIVVVEGSLASVDVEGSRELNAGDHVGASCLLTPRPARATLHAVTTGRCLLLNASEFNHLVVTRPWLGVTLLRHLGEHLAETLDKSGRRELL